MSRIAGFVKIMVTETIGIIEAMSRVAGFVKVMATETVGVIETMLRVVGFVKVMATETVGLVDGFVQRFYAVRQMVETVNVTDASMRRAWRVIIEMFAPIARTLGTPAPSQRTSEHPTAATESQAEAPISTGIEMDGEM